MDLVLTEWAINWFNENGVCIATPDYIAYIIALPKKYKALLVVEVGEQGRWFLLPSDPYKKDNLSKRQYKKALQYLLDTGWIEEDLDPFPEYRPTIKVGHNLILVGDLKRDLSEITDLEPRIPAYDDDIVGLEKFWEENT